MLKHVLAASALAITAPVAAADVITGAAPAMRMTQGAPDGPVIFATGGTEASAGCIARPGSVARLYFTFFDPQGVDYAGVDLHADTVRPAVSDHAETYLWVNPGTREDRAYRYRFEPEGPAYPQVHTMPIDVEVLPSEGPLDIYVEAKDGAGHLTTYDFHIPPEAVVCR